MRSYFNKFLLLGIVVLTSCSQSKETDSSALDFTLEDFESFNFTDEDGDIITPDDLTLGKPYLLSVLSDSVIAIQDNATSNMVTFLNLSNGKFTQGIRQGNGPEELLQITTMMRYKNLLWVAGMDDGKVLAFEFDADSMKTTMRNSTSLSMNPARTIVIDDDDLFVLAPFFSGDRYYRIRTNTVDTIRKFPMDSVTLGVPSDNSYLQADMSISPDHKHIMISNRDWNILEIYDISTGDIRTLRGPIEQNAKVRRQDIGMGYRYIQTPIWFMYNGNSADNSGFYVGFSGSEIKAKEDLGTYPQTILSFDWNGNPRKAYHFDSPIINFTIDEKNGVLYAIQDMPDPVVVRYTLK